MSAILVRNLTMGGASPRVAVKDSIDIAGLPTQCGSRVLSGALPALRHADVVQSLLDAGCAIIGKANMHEFAYGVTGLNAWTGTPDNPRFPGRVPGGSSSGSAAAVAAGLADFALGSDTGGSVRIPAACCGVYGLKPTFGRVSRAGVAPDFTTLDCVGVLADDMPRVQHAMAMIDSSYAPVAAINDALFGIVDVEADPLVLQTIDRALSAAGARTVPTRLASFAAAFDAGLAVIGAETWRALGHHVDHPGMGLDVAARLRAASQIGPGQLREAEAVRRTFTDEVNRALRQVDVLLTPTMPDFPLTLEVAAADPLAALRVTQFVRPFNLSGHPALSIPLRASNGLPVGIQLVGRHGEDARLCAIAQGLSARLPALPEVKS